MLTSGRDVEVEVPRAEPNDLGFELVRGSRYSSVLLSSSGAPPGVSHLPPHRIGDCSLSESSVYSDAHNRALGGAAWILTPSAG